VNFAFEMLRRRHNSKIGAAIRENTHKIFIVVPEGRYKVPVPTKIQAQIGNRMATAAIVTRRGPASHSVH